MIDRAVLREILQAVCVCVCVCVCVEEAWGPDEKREKY